MAGLDPAIHVSTAQDFEMDGAHTLSLWAGGRPWQFV